MMKSTGRAIALLLALMTASYSGTAAALLSASVDRNRIALGDSLRLTISADDDEELSEADLRPLRRNFEVLQQSTRSNTSISNGKFSQSKQLILDITPLREGNLAIPSIPVGKSWTNAIAIMVSNAPDADTGNQNVIFEAEVDNESVYVQGQLILTLRIQQAIELNQLNITNLEIDNAFVKPLEQTRFNRTLNGRNWRVHEIRYAVFPEQSGRMEIPQMTITGRLREPRRGMFNSNNGRLLRRSTAPITIDVKPRPAEFAGGNWLPARQVTIEERWSTPPEQLRAGESTTRTIRIVGEGVLGAQLPPVLFTASDGLKYYPDQPDISEQEVSSGLLGARQDSAAIVPTRAGNWTVPEVRVPWWDTKSEQMRYAVLPGRELTVAAADPLSAPSAALPTTAMTDGTATPAPNSSDVLVWQLLSAASLGGWVLTLLYLWRSRRTTIAPEEAQVHNTSEKRSYKAVLAACDANDATGTRAAIVTWATAMTNSNHLTSLDKVASHFGDAPLQEELKSLNACLYGTSAYSWRAATLREQLQRVRELQLSQAKKPQEVELQLYPQTR